MHDSENYASALAWIYNAISQRVNAPGQGMSLLYPVRVGFFISAEGIAQVTGARRRCKYAQFAELRATCCSLRPQNFASALPQIYTYVSRRR